MLQTIVYVTVLATSDLSAPTVVEIVVVVVFAMLSVVQMQTFVIYRELYMRLSAVGEGFQTKNRARTVHRGTLDPQFWDSNVESLEPSRKVRGGTLAPEYWSSDSDHHPGRGTETVREL